MHCVDRLGWKFHETMVLYKCRFLNIPGSSGCEDPAGEDGGGGDGAEQQGEDP